MPTTPTATADLLAAWGDNIRTYRQFVGLTQAELAKEVGVTPGAIAAYEAGRDEPRTSRKVAIAYALGVTDMAALFPWPDTTRV